MIGDRYVSYAYTTLDQLREEPHHLWTLIFYCLQPDLDYSQLRPLRNCRIKK